MTLPPSIRINPQVPFPSVVNSTGPVTISKSNGIWTVGFNISNIAAVPNSTPLNTLEVLLYNTTTQSFQQTTLDQLGTITTLFTEFVNPQTGASYAIQDGDRAKLITATNAGAQAYTIAQAGTAGQFLAGWYTDIANNSTNPAGIVTITPTTSTINGAATLKIQPGQDARIVSDGVNYQVVFSDSGAQLPGTTTNDAGNAGNVGEIISSSVSQASAVSLSTGTPANMTSIPLTAGDWEVFLNMNFNIAATTTITNLIASISQTSATLDAATAGAEAVFRCASFAPAADILGINVGPIRISLAAPATIFAVAQSAFATSTNKAYGLLKARRPR